MKPKSDLWRVRGLVMIAEVASLVMIALAPTPLAYKAALFATVLGTYTILGLLISSGQRQALGEERRKLMAERELLVMRLENGDYDENKRPEEEKRIKVYDEQIVQLSKELGEQR